MTKEWTTVRMFRCVQDPMIGPKPKQAFMLSDLPGWNAYYHIPSGTLHCKTSFNDIIHIVGAGNLNKVEALEGDYGPFQDRRDENEKEANEKTNRKREPRTLSPV